MRFDTLEQWLAWQESLHPSEIDLGLERLRLVARRLGLERPARHVVSVAGTNGKGSSVAMLEAIYRAAGYRVGAYTSPHLLRYNERIRIDGEEVADADLCAAFERIDRARGEISLTYFEFGTLAALDLFAAAGLDVAILEVGLGGRLDAVNLVDADVAIITTVDLDHQAWLGGDRESIGREKAGIARPGRPLVCGDPDPPASVADEARRIGATLYRQGAEFRAEEGATGWRWIGSGRRRDALPLPALRGRGQLENAAAVVMAVELLGDRLPVGQGALRDGLAGARVAGRFQVVPGEVAVILDVAHNPQSARALADNLAAWPCPGQTHAVVAMMADKAIDEVVACLAPHIDHWHATTVEIPRAAPAQRLAGAVAAAGGRCSLHTSVAEALEAARREVAPPGRIVVFGSFFTVAGALPLVSA